LTEHVALAASQLGGLPITNTLLSSIIVACLLAAAGYFATRNMSLVPSGLQNLVEFAVESLFNLIDSIVGDPRQTRMFFPWIATFFLYIMVANYFGLLPGVGTIGFFHGHEFVPYLRSAASDLNMTLGLALFSVLLAHFYSIKELGLLGYLGVWFNINPFLLFSGVLELFLELAKVTSLAFRLFGNIFAGETVLEVISGIITPYVVPLPFMALEVVVGFVQALVFAMLTLASLIILTTGHSSHETHEAEATS
jgi:F-type H+-transporting ATPase subunit a